MQVNRVQRVERGSVTRGYPAVKIGTRLCSAQQDQLQQPAKMGWLGKSDAS
jgi:hypothetical protein